MRTLLTILALGALLIAAIFGGFRVWTSMAGVAMPWQGWLALSLGVIFTLALGVGLMALVFYSARHGHDEAHHMLHPYGEPASDEAPSPDQPRERDSL